MFAAKIEISIMSQFLTAYAQINLDGQLKESSLYTVGGKAPDGSGSDGGSGGSDGNQGENPLG